MVTVGLRGSRMLSLIALSFLLVKDVSAKYYTAAPDGQPTADPPIYYMSDPEPKEQNLFDKSHYVEDFDRPVPGEERMVGYTYAGRAEFPWIVDVRFEASDDYELHSVGNIVTRSRVLTTCRIVLYANHYRKVVENKEKVDPSDLDGLRWSIGLHQNWVALKIAYCANFLWIRYHDTSESEYASHFPPEVNPEADFEGGEQVVRHIAAHPKCEENALVFDFAILALSTSIIPMPPTLTTIPVFVSLEFGVMTDFDLSKHINERRLCFVGSFGKPYKNSKTPPTLDYKVKYRTYFTAWDECSKIWDLVGPPSEEGNTKPYWCPQLHSNCEFDKNLRKDLMCFSTRARVGSVCDHDRGAPVVCEETVYGFVTRGAEFRYCSNLIHIPFLVVKATSIREYFKVSDYDRYFMPRMPTTRTPFIRGGAASPEVPAVLLAVTIFTFLITDFPLLPFKLGL